MDVEARADALGPMSTLVTNLRATWHLCTGKRLLTSSCDESAVVKGRQSKPHRPVTLLVRYQIFAASSLVNVVFCTLHPVAKVRVLAYLFDDVSLLVKDS